MTATQNSASAQTPATPEVSKRTEPVAPRGMNHLVINVRDIEESHHFWCNLLGFRQVGNLVAAPDGRERPTMRFYSGVRGAGEGQHHHDIALMEQDDLPPPPEKWTLGSGGSAVNHIAITYPDRDSWREQVQFLIDSGVKIGRRTDHGMTHSIYITDPNGYGVEVLYDLPREVWENNIDGALNYAVDHPRDDALHDDTDYLDDFTGWGEPGAQF